MAYNEVVLNFKFRFSSKAVSSITRKLQQCLIFLLTCKLWICQFGQEIIKMRANMKQIVVKKEFVVIEFDS